MTDVKMYMADIGIPSINYNSYSGSKQLFIMAKSYGEASRKALIHLSSLPNPTPSLVGSVDDPEEPQLRVIAIRLITDKIIW